MLQFLYGMNQYTISIKGQRVNILGSADHTVSIRSCSCGSKAVTGNIVRLYYKKIYLCKLTLNFI